MPSFPSLEWMQAYAAALATHPQGGAMAAALDGRYRFVVEPGDGLAQRHAYELTVAPGADGGQPLVEAAPAGEAEAVLEVSATLPRWRELVEGRSDLLMAMLLRRVRVQGDVGRVRSRLSDARPLLDSLHAVPTDWPP